MFLQENIVYNMENGICDWIEPVSVLRPLIEQKKKR